MAVLLWRVLRLLLFAAAGFYLLAAALAFTFQRRLIYPAPPPEAPNLEGATVLRYAEGRGLAVHVPARPGRPTLAFFHGNGEQLAYLDIAARVLTASGMGFFAIEYPGYSGLPGEPSEGALFEAAEAGLKELQRLGVPSSETVLVGQSLGTGVAAEMARRGHARALVLISPYTSMVDMAALTLPWLPTSVLTRDRFDTASRLPELKVPVLLIHGTEDEVVPFRMGKALAGIVPGARFVPLEGAGHNDIWWGNGRRVAAAIDEFVSGAAKAGAK